MEARRPLYLPPASVVVPCRGLDQSLRANLAALFTQHYPRYEILFVADSADDAALRVAKELAGEFARQGSETAVRFIVAGQTEDCGQKVHNLRAAVAQADTASEVFVFVDTDARTRPDWLRSLVAPLADQNTGATTGYRWFLPVVGNFSSQLRSVWNASIASALGANTRRNFCWGGSTAIRREIFEHLNVRERWRGTLSDDFTLTRTLQAAQMPIRFVPNCLVASHEDSSFGELVEFTTRQLKITRVYAPHLWLIVLWSNLVWSLVFYGGICLSLSLLVAGSEFYWPAAIVCAIYLLGMWKAFFRLRAVALPLADYHAALRRSVAAHLFAWPLASLLYVYNALAALFSRRINWRGITYELKSPRETVIISAATEAAGIDGAVETKEEPDGERTTNSAT